LVRITFFTMKSGRRAGGAREEHGRNTGGEREVGGSAELCLYLFGPDGRLTEGTYLGASLENFESGIEAMITCSWYE
jgi:hypothetical protein